jgi:RNA polymerase sigma-70 factor (ECF subfamily)
MRDLARGLLADPGAADDVVQEAWLAAHDHPPLADRPLEPWLARVVRNLAWKRRRGEARRRLHEGAARAPEPAPGPEATAERLELQRTVLAAVEAVPEPFRTTVVERYLEGRSSAEIARALGLPEGTVRWRLKRGLEELRRRLDARCGGREVWSALLLPVAASPAPAGAAARPGTPLSLTLPTGVLTMIATSKIVLATVLGAAAVGFVLWQGTAPRGGEKEEVARAAAPPTAEPAAPLARAEEPAAREETPPTEPVTRLEDRRPAPGAVPALAPEARPADAHVAMRFVDAGGAPWGDVAVLELGSDVPRGTSDRDGRVELRLSSPRFAKDSEAPDPGTEWTVQLLARRAGCATLLLRAVTAAGRTTDLGDLVLSPGARIEGRVVDEAGVAIAGSRVGLAAPEPFRDEDEGLARRHGAPGFERTPSVESDAGGAFVLDGVAPGRWRLWGHARGTRYGWTEPFETAAGESVSQVEVRLPALLPTDRITGIVLDPAGNPLPSTRLTSTYELEHEGGTTTEDLGPDGRFDLVLEREATYSFVASDLEHRYADAVATDVEPGARDLELRLGEKRVFDVLARDRDGRPVESCRFELAVEVGGAVLEDSTPPERKEPGLYVLALPARPFRLEIEADGYLPVRFEELRPETVGSRLAVVLDRASRLRGRIHAGGEPVPDERVTLHRPVGGGSYAHDGFDCVYEGRSSLREVRTDAEGRFELTCVSAEPVWLRASAAGWVAGELGPLDPLSERELSIELTQGGAIEGRVLLPDGADAAGIVVGINHGDCHARTQRAGAGGRFRFDDLTPGNWQVLRRDEELDPSSITVSRGDEPVEIEWSCTVEAGRTTHCDLDLTRP